MISDEKIATLEKLGFKRWTKGNLDRLYIDACQLGLVCSFYKTGNISHAEFNGETISNSQGRRLRCAKTFVDIKTGKVYSDCEVLKKAAEELAALGSESAGDVDEHE